MAEYYNDSHQTAQAVAKRMAEVISEQVRARKSTAPNEERITKLEEDLERTRIAGLMLAEALRQLLHMLEAHIESEHE